MLGTRLYTRKCPFPTLTSGVSADCAPRLLSRDFGRGCANLPAMVHHDSARAETLSADRPASSRSATVLAGVYSLPFRLAGITCALLVVWGTAVRVMVMFHEGVPERYRWVHFALGSGYELMSGCLGALIIYAIASVAPRVGRWSAWTLITVIVTFNYSDFVYYLLFQTHVPFSAVEYLPQISNFGSSFRAAILDVRFALMVLLPALLAAWLLLRPGARPAPRRPRWGWKGHALAAGGFLLVGLIANTASNSYVGKNPENALQFTPLQHFLRTRSQLKAAPAVLTAAVLSELQSPDHGYPLLHERDFTGCRHPAPAFRALCAGVPRAGGQARPNVVIFLLESFRAQELGALGGTAGISPHFDALTRQGILFRDFYGNGYQTRDGIVAGYCSLYPNTGLPILGSYQKVKQRCLPEMLEERGYRTVWIHNGNADFDGQREFLLRNGIQRIVDRWDFPLGTPTAGWGATDEALVDEALKVMHGLPEPFFASILSITNHHPFEPPAGFAVHGKSEYNRFLDTMAYTDLALGEFFERVRAEPYFRNTVFLITADHGVPQPIATPVKTLQDDLVWRHHIPLLILAGWLTAPAAVDAPGSQVDLPPLVMDLLGGRAAVPWVGESPVGQPAAQPDEQPALVVRPGNYVGLLGARGAAVWTRGAWQTVGQMDPARLRWADDVMLASRWALEQGRIVPGP